MVEDLISVYQRQGLKKFTTGIHGEILKIKIKFPLLEFVGETLYKNIPSGNQIELLDAMIATHEMGAFPIAGKLLQLRADQHLTESFRKAEKYIIEGDEWYVCDIIGERVFGHALLHWPEKTIPVLKKMAKHENQWMVRCIGVATHYAVKKGLDKNNANKVFHLLLSLSNETEFHTRKGIGWGAKTIAKFYPDIINAHTEEIQNKNVRAWFKTKLKIGLGRANKYAR